MKIGILTQPLTANYGGIIQNWALQQALIKLGHEPITLDLLPEERSFGSYIKDNVNQIMAHFRDKKKYVKINRYKIRPKKFDRFVKENIYTTHKIRKYKESIIKEYKIEGLIVGSDQVWRPIYNWGYLEDMFFRFAQNSKCIKASYASSFGTSEWEFTESQTKECRNLIKQFKDISVRESSGVNLCLKYLKTEAKVVLDPTLLLSKMDYLKLIDDTECLIKKRFLAAYVLDLNDEVYNKIINKAESLNLTPIFISADSNANYTIKEWLSIFRDAEYIYTDSFHGSLFSIIFEKKFEFIENEKRGSTRFQVIRDLLKNNNVNYLKDKSIEFLRNVYG